MSNKLVKFPKEEKEKNNESSLNMGTLYDMNKQLIAQTAKPLNHLELLSKQKALEEWFNWIIDTYAMLLCHERRDYTIFHLYEKENKNPPAVAALECMDCLTNRGTIVAIDENEDKAWEIWLLIDNEYYCYYLFRYDEAVIEC